MGMQVERVTRAGAVPIYRIMAAGRLIGYAVRGDDGGLVPCATLADARRMARG